MSTLTSNLENLKETLEISKGLTGTSSSLYTIESYFSDKEKERENNTPDMAPDIIKFQSGFELMMAGLDYSKYSK